MSEAFAVELSYAYAIDVDSGLGGFLKTEGELKEVIIHEVMSMYYNINILWSPIYGKISFLGMKLTHFDTYLGLGAGIIHTTEYPTGNPDGNPVPKPAGNTVLGFRWFITDYLNIHTEYRHFFFQKMEEVGGISMPVEFSLGVVL